MTPYDSVLSGANPVSHPLVRSEPKSVIISSISTSNQVALALKNNRNGEAVLFGTSALTALALTILLSIGILSGPIGWIGVAICLTISLSVAVNPQDAAVRETVEDLYEEQLTQEINFSDDQIEVTNLPEDIQDIDCSSLTLEVKNALISLNETVKMYNFYNQVSTKRISGIALSRKETLNTQISTFYENLKKSLSDGIGEVEPTSASIRNLTQQINRFMTYLENTPSESPAASRLESDSASAVSEPESPVAVSPLSLFSDSDNDVAAAHSPVALPSDNEAAVSSPSAFPLPPANSPAKPQKIHIQPDPTSSDYDSEMDEEEDIDAESIVPPPLRSDDPNKTTSYDWLRDGNLNDD